MAKSILGETIGRLRREAGLTQEELGRAVGVTTQAVSRWECGGTPDVELLPAIARRLNVSVDALFDLDPARAIHTEDLIKADLRNTAPEKRMQRACDLVWAAQKALCALDVQGVQAATLLDAMEFADRRAVEPREEMPWCCYFDMEGGLMQHGIAQDMRYALVLPESADGFAAMLKTPQAYLRLFALLARPNRLMALLHAHQNRVNRRFTDRMAAVWLGVDVEAAREALEDLCENGLMHRNSVEDETGELRVYSADNGNMLMVFLFFCQPMMRSKNEPMMGVQVREGRPLLNRMPGEGAVKPDWKPEVSEDEWETVAQHAYAQFHAEPEQANAQENKEGNP